MRAAVLLLLAPVLATLPAARADTTGNGPEGQRMTVSRTSGLNPAGETVTVSGTGYDVDKGIYVAVCSDTGAGAVPTPCGGGAATSGSTGASHWISSNPPAYGEGLAVPYGPGGSFRVTLRVSPTIGTVDCRRSRCAVVSRADHTRSGDRSQDVRLRITFAGAPRTTAPAAPRTTAPAASRTTAPGSRTTAPAPATRTTTAAPTPAGLPVETAAAPPSGTAGPARPPDLQVTRVSASQSANRWWAATTGVLAAALLAMATAGVIRRRRTRREP